MRIFIEPDVRWWSFRELLARKGLYWLVYRMDAFGDTICMTSDCEGAFQTDGVVDWTTLTFPLHPGWNNFDLVRVDRTE